MMNSWAALPHPTQPGQVGGHEGVGKIVKMGPGTENSNVKVGDRVGVKWVSGTCGSCGMSSSTRFPCPPAPTVSLQPSSSQAPHRHG